MFPPSLIVRWSDLADPQMLAAALGSAAMAAGLGVQAAKQFHIPQLGWLAALVGAASTIFTLMPSMLLCGSLGAGVYALLGTRLQVESVFAGKTVVAVSTALGCALVAWLLCLLLLAAPAVLVAIRRRLEGQ